MEKAPNESKPWQLRTSKWQAGRHRPILALHDGTKMAPSVSFEKVLIFYLSMG